MKSSCSKTSRWTIGSPMTCYPRARRWVYSSSMVDRCARFCARCCRTTSKTFLLCWPCIDPVRWALTLTTTTRTVRTNASRSDRSIPSWPKCWLRFWMRPMASSFTKSRSCPSLRCWPVTPWDKLTFCAEPWVRRKRKSLIRNSSPSPRACSIAATAKMRLTLCGRSWFRSLTMRSTKLTLPGMASFPTGLRFSRPITQPNTWQRYSLRSRMTSALAARCRCTWLSVGVWASRSCHRTSTTQTRISLHEEKTFALVCRPFAMWAKG